MLCRRKRVTPHIHNTGDGSLCSRTINKTIKKETLRASLLFFSCQKSRPLSHIHASFVPPGRFTEELLPVLPLPKLLVSQVYCGFVRAPAP